MLRLYREHPEFDAYTLFDTETGKLTAIDENEFKKYLALSEEDDKKISSFSGPCRETNTRFPRRIYFQITRQCQLNCSYCFIKADKQSDHVPTKAVMDVAEYFGGQGLMEVRLTGGEPTRHPDFFDIVRKFQHENVYVSIATNGAFCKDIRDRLSELDNVWLICSVDGNREIHNRYRPNTYDLIIENLKKIKETSPGIRIRLTTVLTRENMGQMRELGEICIQVGAESITVIPLRPQVRDDKARELMVNAGQFKQVIEDLIKTKNELGINFTTTLETDYKDQIHKDPVFRKKSSCAAGREGTNLDYDPVTKQFITYGCAYSPASDFMADSRLRKPFMGGSFPVDRPEEFWSIWQDDSAWTLFRNMSLKSDECLNCNYYERSLCVGSCPIQNLNYDEIKAGQDLQEQLRKQIQGTAEWYCYKNYF